MGVLAECRGHYERYLAAIAEAQAAVSADDTPAAEAAVAEAGRSLAALARLAPAVAAARRLGVASPAMGPAATDELQQLARLVAVARDAAGATVAALRERQARTIADLTALVGAVGPYGGTPVASLLMDRNA